MRSYRTFNECSSRTSETAPRRCTGVQFGIFQRKGGLCYRSLPLHASRSGDLLGYLPHTEFPKLHY
jgi:hypothetical protein